MIVLDHNVPEQARDELRRAGVRARIIGIDIGWPAMDDMQDILRLLQHLRQPTFFSRDHGFFARSLCHARYCLVVMTASPQGSPQYIRRLLRHPHFRTWASRAGTVVRVSSANIAFYRLHDDAFHEVGWR